jgi:hypothetical protein
MKRIAGIEKFWVINFNWKRSCADGFSVVAGDIDVAVLRTVAGGCNIFHQAIKRCEVIVFVGYVSRG